MAGQRQGPRPCVNCDGGGMRRGEVGTIWRALLFLVFGVALVQPTSAPLAEQTGTATGLPIPRYVSLKTDRVNLREGPSKEHATTWVFQRAGLPVEITAEFETWRRVRDSEGAEGWVLHSLLSGRRTALVAPWKKGEDFKTLHRAARERRPRGDLAVRRHRQYPDLRRRLVPDRWRGLQGLYSAVQSLGRLSWREARLGVCFWAGAARGGNRRRPARPATISANARAGCASTR